MESTRFIQLVHCLLIFNRNSDYYFYWKLGAKILLHHMGNSLFNLIFHKFYHNSKVSFVNFIDDFNGYCVSSFRNCCNMRRIWKIWFLWKQNSRKTNCVSFSCSPIYCSCLINDFLISLLYQKVNLIHQTFAQNLRRVTFKE